MPTSTGGFAPLKPAAKPARAAAATVEGVWEDPSGGSAPLELRYTTDKTFMGGFMGSVQVSNWTAGAVVTLDYSGTDVVVQRLFNGDIIDAHGEPVPAFSLLAGKGGQRYIVRLHAKAVHSASDSPTNALTFVAAGTPQGPEMAVGSDELDDDALAPLGQTDVLRYHPSPYAHPGGFEAAIEVRPWVVGANVTVDFRGSDVEPTGWHNGRLVARRGDVYTIELRDFTRSDAEYTPDSSLLLKATGAPDFRPALSKVVPGSDDDDDDDDEALPMLELARAQLRTGARGLGVLSAAAFVGGALLVARRRKRANDAAEPLMTESILDGEGADAYRAFSA
jgi:hypothetical protein